MCYDGVCDGKLREMKTRIYCPLDGKEVFSWECAEDCRYGEIERDEMRRKTFVVCKISLEKVEVPPLEIRSAELDWNTEGIPAEPVHDPGTLNEVVKK